MHASHLFISFTPVYYKCIRGMGRGLGSPNISKKGLIPPPHIFENGLKKPCGECTFYLSNDCILDGQYTVKHIPAPLIYIRINANI